MTRRPLFAGRGGGAQAGRGGGKTRRGRGATQEAGGGKEEEMRRAGWGAGCKAGRDLWLACSGVYRVGKYRTGTFIDLRAQVIAVM